jgi:ribose transport system substrate-binding protein
MRKLAVWIGATATALVAVSAHAAETKTIGFSWNVKDTSLIQAWEDYLKAESQRQGAEAGLQIEWVINVANSDPARQAANIEDLLNQNVDLVMARAEDAAAIGASIRAAEEADIPFITFDRASSTTKPTAHVGGDSYDQGITTAEGLVVLLDQAGVKGKCIELQGALTDVNAVNRSKAWNEVVARSNGTLETIVQVPTEWKPELFLSGASNALKAHPEANCMFAASDFAFSAVQSALEGSGKWAKTGDDNHVWLATQDLFPAAVKAMEEGYVDISTSYDAYNHAKEAIRVAVLVLQGQDPGCPEDGCLAKGRVATQATIGSLDNLWSRDYKD